MTIALHFSAAMPEEVVEKKESKISKMASEMSTFCYNSDDGTVMGRTGISWRKFLLSLIIGLITFGF